MTLDDYFTAIEITTIKDKDERQKVKQMLDTSHMFYTYGAQPRRLSTGLNINDLSEEVLDF